MLGLEKRVIASGISSTLEDSLGSASCTQVYRLYIHATPEAVWEAIVDPDLTARYGYRVRCAYDLRPGAAFMGFPSEEMRRLGVPNATVDGVVLADTVTGTPDCHCTIVMPAPTLRPFSSNLISPSG